MRRARRLVPVRDLVHLAEAALPEHVTLSDTLEAATPPELVVSGNYLFAAWRGGDVGGGAGDARVKFATSVDVGATFTAPATFGDGAAAQAQLDLQTKLQARQVPPRGRSTRRTTKSPALQWKLRLRL